ncbi:VOC family protein [Microbacterium terricola]|uniref:Glyoxalase n=1 Tax=Microbacterium terricola TaxID=344163 RepID=A0ABM8DXY5_9MICO|nr:VOC family protein [Microbacterium terricola]UYK38855.1 VOC family protein [Microbacterium terricola]BDV30449.1 glyoxalase [Microbacterium terricola]
MEQRLTVVTLGTTDLERAIAFYRALGWEPHPSSVEGDVAFYQVGGSVFALWSRAELAADSCVDDAGGWGGITLAHNVRSPEDVDVVLEAASQAGAQIGRAGAPTPWGGYSGVFIDLDGHPWEIAHNPSWPLAADGSVSLG